jgi:formylglycine-generating enzyme required for sulfatase activity
MIISFSGDSVLGSGRLLVCFDEQPPEPLLMPVVEVRPGKFKMGHGPDAKPTEIERAFSIGVTPVTQKQWETVMKTRPWDRQCNDCDDYPATGIIWSNAVAFCRVLSEMQGGSYRLPTEAEWEYACRAGSDTLYCFGDEALGLSDFGWYGREEPNFKRMMIPPPVGQKKPNAWGLYDMHGNVWEWCADLCAPSRGTMAFAENPNPRYRVLRGGSWKDRAEKCSSAYREPGTPDFKDPFTGFRVCLDLV